MSRKNIFLSTVDLAKGKTLHGEYTKQMKKMLEKGLLKLPSQKPVKGPGWIDMPSIPGLGKTAQRVRDMMQSDIDKYNLRNVNLSKSLKHKIIVDKNNIIGFGAIDPKEEELKQLWINKEFRRKGYGKKILESFSRYPKKILVNKSNRSGQKFYNSLGFKDSGERVGELGKILMTKTSQGILDSLIKI